MKLKLKDNYAFWLLYLLAFLGGLLLVWNVGLEELSSRQMRAVEKSLQEIGGVERKLRVDLTLMRNIPEMRSWQQAQDHQSRIKLEQMLRALLLAHSEIDQARVVALDGVERIRVSRSGEGIKVARDSELQDKSQRAYSVQSLRLQADEIYISRIELNRENGEIEQPYKPVIRASVGLFDHAGQRLGYLIFNRTLLLRFDHQTGANLAVVDSQGKYLYNSDFMEKAWGEDLGSGYRIQQDFSAEHLSLIQQQQQGIVHKGSELIFFNSVMIGDQKITGISNVSLFKVFLHSGAILPLGGLLLLMLLIGRVIWRSYLLEQHARHEIEKTAMALEEKDRRLRAVIDAAVDGFVLINQDNRIQVINQAALQMFGYSEGELLNHSCDQIIPEQYREAHRRGVKHFVETKEGKNIGCALQVEGVRKNGETFPIEVSVGAFEAGSGWFFTGVLRDITDRLQQEEKMRDQEMREYQAWQAGVHEMSSSMLHNIGNAVSGIYGTISRLDKELESLGMLPQGINKVLSDDNTPPDPSLLKKLLHSAADTIEVIVKEKAAPQIETLHLSIEHIAELIRAQRSVVGVSQGAVSFNLRVLIEDVQQLLSDNMLRNRIEFSSEGGGDLQMELPRNPLVQLMVNLIKNAIESIEQSRAQGLAKSDEGQIQLVVEALEHDMISLALTDNGIGFDPSGDNNLFTFGYTTKESGSGMGLHSASNFVGKIGGTIRASSEGVGQGATFIIEIPLQQRSGVGKQRWHIQQEKK